MGKIKTSEDVGEQPYLLIKDRYNAFEKGEYVERLIKEWEKNPNGLACAGLINDLESLIDKEAGNKREAGKGESE